jgi:hypothetical protein
LRPAGPPFGVHWLVSASCGGRTLGLTLRMWSPRGYFEKIRVFKAGLRLDISAWNNTIGLLSYFVGLGTGVMIKRNSWGHSYAGARGEILGFPEDELLRKHLPRMFSLIKNESWGLEDD